MNVENKETNNLNKSSKNNKTNINRKEKNKNVKIENLEKIDSIDRLEVVENKKKHIKSKEKNNKKFIIIICVVSFLVLLFLLLIITFPFISIKGDKEVSIGYNEEYVEPGYKGLKFFKDISDKITVIRSINNKKIGSYNIVYYYPYLWFKVKKIRNVTVVDNVKPEIVLEGDLSVNVCPNTEYKEQGYSAIDEYDGDITSRVKVKNNTDFIDYKVKDSSGNEYEIKRSLFYKDIEKPSIELKGNSDITIYVGDSYVEQGYSAIDNCDGDISSKVEVIGNVNTSSVGTYTITYKVLDSSNNEAIVTRSVIVKQRSIIRPSGGGSGRGIVYLTFDDGPNEGTTNVILDILKEEGVSATFFVTCNGPDYLIKRMYDEGHTVALHTATHNYSYVYSSDASYFEDLNRVSDRVERITGVKSMIIRFPGGSSNTVSRKFSPGIMSRLTEEVKARGYHYFDWNVDSNDAAGAGTNGVYSNVVNNISLNRENVVLMHDVKIATRDAIRSIIRYGKDNGYTFKKITYDTVMVTHGVNN